MKNSEARVRIQYSGSDWEAEMAAIDCLGKRTKRMYSTVESTQMYDACRSVMVG